jgi:probable phosphomutase (TIGR03848 family)
MPVILLVRHGENDYVKKGMLAGRLPGVHLNNAGHEQAQMLADRLSGMGINTIYSSPLDRAIETAQPLAHKLNLECIVRPELIEIDFGEWQGRKLRELSRLKPWKVVQSTPGLMQFPGGETFADAQHRISSELLNIATIHNPTDMIVCVSHADPIKLAIAYFIGLPLDLFQRLVISPGSVSILRQSEHGSQLIALNINPAQSFLY